MSDRNDTANLLSRRSALAALRRASMTSNPPRDIAPSQALAATQLSSLLRESSVQNILRSTNTNLLSNPTQQDLIGLASATPTAASIGNSCPSMTALASNSLLLANAIAQERQRELVEARTLVTDAYRRGREEAILSLIRYGALGSSSLLGGISSSLTPSATAVATSASPHPPASCLVRQTMSEATAKRTNEDALRELGAAGLARRKVNLPYFDASNLNDPDPLALANRRTRGGVTEPFPERLHRMLREVERDGKDEIVAFMPHGRAFRVLNPTRFVAEILPKYFKQSRLSSFQRQLNLYGFTRITSGPDAGGYYHELFLKGRARLTTQMRRVGVAQGKASKVSEGMPSRPTASGNEPDFYSMPAIKEKPKRR